MITHSIPEAPTAREESASGKGGCRGGPPGAQGPCSHRLYAPLCLHPRPAIGHQGARVGAGFIPRGIAARRVRRFVLLPGVGPAGARCRRQRLAGGDRNAHRAVSTLFRTTRAVFARALWHERNTQDRWRGPRCAERSAQSPCRHRECRDVCRPRSQISNLGAWALPRGTYGGHRKGPRVQSRTGNPDGGGTSARSTGMMTSSDSNAVAGGVARHIPVLAATAIEWLAVRSGGTYLDATFGGGGYTRAILQTSGARVIAIDRDCDAVAAGAALEREAQGRLTLTEGLFSDLDAIAARHGVSGLDGVVFDVGISSMQIDNAGRGFSFRLDGPLDMRMGGFGTSAADVVARASERQLATIIAVLGEERHARAVARAVVKARTERPIETTRALADLVAKVVWSRDSTIHPATRTFQALRIFVNDELGELARGLDAAERALKPSGRLVVVAFHSLEDRIVKSFLTTRSRAPSSSRHQPQPTAVPPSFRVLTRRPLTPDEAEVEANPRARSAKVRDAERTDAPPHLATNEALLPSVPTLDDIMRGRG